MADTTYGLTTTGFAAKTLTQVRADLNAQVQAKFGASFDVSDTSVTGQIVGILAEAIYLLWEIAEAVNSSQDPDKATAAALDALSALTGTSRPQATSSAVGLTLTGDGGTDVPQGSLAQALSTGSQFATLADSTFVALTAWATDTTYALGARVTANGNAYQCSTAGNSSHTGSGPAFTTYGVPLDDNGGTAGTIRWLYLGQGVAAADVSATCTVTGPVIALAFDIAGSASIPAPGVAGWRGVVNLLDAAPGTNIATDPALRQLRVAELAGGGTSTQPAVRAVLLEVPDVTAATVFVNNTDTTNSDSMPPHSVEAMVLDGDDQAIRDALFSAVAAGIATTGNTDGSVTDSQGTVHDVKFTRPTAIPIYVAVTLTYDATAYPADGDEEVKTAIADWAAGQPTGKDAVSTAFLAQAFTIPGVLDVPVCNIGTAPSPGSSTTIPISLRQIMSVATVNITVSSSPATP